MLSATEATGRRCCLSRLRIRAGSLRRVRRWLFALQILQAQLQLHDPLLLIVRTELASMSYQLLGAVPLQKTSEVSDLCLELQVRLLLSDQLVVAALVRAASCDIRPRFTFLALISLSSIVFH